MFKYAGATAAGSNVIFSPATLVQSGASVLFTNTLAPRKALTNWLYTDLQHLYWHLLISADLHGNRATFM